MRAPVADMFKTLQVIGGPVCTMMCASTGYFSRAALRRSVLAELVRFPKLMPHSTDEDLPFVKEVWLRLSLQCLLPNVGTGRYG
jgi:hypothetical protein